LHHAAGLRAAAALVAPDHLPVRLPSGDRDSCTHCCRRGRLASRTPDGHRRQSSRETVDRAWAATRGMRGPPVTPPTGEPGRPGGCACRSLHSRQHRHRGVAVRRNDAWPAPRPPVPLPPQALQSGAGSARFTIWRRSNGNSSSARSYGVVTKTGPRRSGSVRWRSIPRGANRVLERRAGIRALLDL
jgi:hypothetical protein